MNAFFSPVERLLIVPCGIETEIQRVSFSALLLLIVPCGIETWSNVSSMRLPLTFNRTLWN